MMAVGLLGSVEPVSVRSRPYVAAVSCRRGRASHFVIRELLGFGLFGDGGQARELVAGARQLGHTVAAGDRQPGGRLVERAAPGRPKIFLTPQSALYVG